MAFSHSDLYGLSAMKTIITIVIMLVVTGCLRKVETDDQDVKEEKRPSGNELPPEPPPPPDTPTNK